MKTEVKIKKLDPAAVLPSYGSEFSAGADLYYLGDVPLTIEAGCTVLVHTGIALEIPEGLVGLIFARSGLASKRALAPANKVGVIDSDYRGEIMVALHNHSNTPQTIEAHERVAQLVLMPYVTASFVLAEKLDDTKRGEGGFGSTGKL